MSKVIKVDRKENVHYKIDEINFDFFEGFDKVLIVGNHGSGAYPIFRWQIFNLNNQYQYLWVDNIGSKSFIDDLKKDNINVLYNESLEDLGMMKKYQRLFINIVENQSINLDEAISRITIPFTLRVPAREIGGYSVERLRKDFDLIIIAKPNFEDEITQLINIIPELKDEIKLLKHLDDVIFVGKSNVQVIKFKITKDFPLNASGV
ncbi:hypothetical protein HZI73_26395 (plasmid) [Vallitalea pronyensis]|uniref:Uncharacterized protein n=1 Tax=Vallitalea pronyensis TaxID=1348613 RepID=A0A8J8SJT3_9FIRM|nr:hypothetical protein [Vallitalea pronyensis]QUI25946.1 hypothetical protein HZI73_26395 [Vallitalea pronyensis]